MTPPADRVPDAPTPPPPGGSAAPDRILLIRPSALGDVCRSVPVLAALRRSYPAAAIDWLVQDTFVPAVENHPALSGIVPFPRKALSRWTSPATWPRVRAFLHDLKCRRYDLVLDCQGLARSGLFAWATRAPRRVGLANAAEFGWLGVTERVQATSALHAVDRMMLVARAAGADTTPPPDLRLYSSAADREHVRCGLGLGDGPFVLLAPTSRWPAKLWPADRYAAVARGLLDAGAARRIVFVGSAPEAAQCGPLIDLASRDPRVVNLLGRTSVGQLMATVEAAALVIGSDSAAIHMAVGFDRPLVALFGPTDVSRVGPYRRGADVIQHVGPGDRLDHKDAAAGAGLMARIGVDEVLTAAKARLAAGRPAVTLASRT